MLIFSAISKKVVPPSSVSMQEVVNLAAAELNSLRSSKISLIVSVLVAFITKSIFVRMFSKDVLTSYKLESLKKSYIFWTSSLSITISCDSSSGTIPSIISKQSLNAVFISS